MIIYSLRKLAKLLKLNTVINRDYDKSIVFELWLKQGKKISIDFYPLWKLEDFTLYRKTKNGDQYYTYTGLDLPWIHLAFMNFYDEL